MDSACLGPDGSIVETGIRGSFWHMAQDVRDTHASAQWPLRAWIGGKADEYSQLRQETTGCFRVSPSGYSHGRLSLYSRLNESTEACGYEDLLENDRSVAQLTAELTVSTGKTTAAYTGSLSTLGRALLIAAPLI